MILSIASPHSLAALPLWLMARDYPQAARLMYFENHDKAFQQMLSGEFDLLCTGFTEPARLQAESLLKPITTFVWGLSAFVSTDAEIKTFSDLCSKLSPEAGKTCILPFAGSPLDIQVRALAQKSWPHLLPALVNQPLPQTLQAFMQGARGVAILPEPMASLLAARPNAVRIADLSEIWAMTNSGNAFSPQVSLFGPAKSVLPNEFMKKLAICIHVIPQLNAEELKPFAQDLGMPAEIIQASLSHVIFSILPETKARQIETEYTTLVGNLNKAKN
jgi:hypothetical protein